MALKATIHKAELSVADMDRHYYAEHSLTIARHPSEKDTRMMVRLLAFAMYASDSLQFTRGLSTEDEPDLWQKNHTEDIEHWIELGQPDEKRLRKACGRSRQVTCICYSGHSAEIWWQQQATGYQRFENLNIINLPADDCTVLTKFCSRNMALNITLQDGHILVSNHVDSTDLAPEVWK